MRTVSKCFPRVPGGRRGGGPGADRGRGLRLVLVPGGASDLPRHRRHRCPADRHRAHECAIGTVRSAESTPWGAVAGRPDPLPANPTRRRRRRGAGRAGGAGVAAVRVVPAAGPRPANVILSGEVFSVVQLVHPGPLPARSGGGLMLHSDATRPRPAVRGAPVPPCRPVPRPRRPPRPDPYPRPVAPKVPALHRCTAPASNRARRSLCCRRRPSGRCVYGPNS